MCGCVWAGVGVQLPYIYIIYTEEEEPQECARVRLCVSISHNLYTIYKEKEEPEDGICVWLCVCVPL